MYMYIYSDKNDGRIFQYVCEYEEEYEILQYVNQINEDTRNGNVNYLFPFLLN